MSIFVYSNPFLFRAFRGREKFTQLQILFWEESVSELFSYKVFCIRYNKLENKIVLNYIYQYKINSSTVFFTVLHMSVCLELHFLFTSVCKQTWHFESMVMFLLNLLDWHKGKQTQVDYPKMFAKYSRVRMRVWLNAEFD